MHRDQSSGPSCGDKAADMRWCSSDQPAPCADPRYWEQNKCLLYLTKASPCFVTLLWQHIRVQFIVQKYVSVDGYLVENYWAIHFASKLYRFASLSVIVRVLFFILVKL